MSRHPLAIAASDDNLTGGLTGNVEIRQGPASTCCIGQHALIVLLMACCSGEHRPHQNTQLHVVALQPFVFRHSLVVALQPFVWPGAMWSNAKTDDTVAAVVASWKRPASGQSGGQVVSVVKNRKCGGMPPVVKPEPPKLPVLVLHDSDSEDDDDDSRLAYHRLTLYLGGSSMPQATFESRFGRVNGHYPFGKHVWDGLVRGYPEYCRVVAKDWCRQMNLWLGAFAMPENFSKSVARAPAPVGKGHAELVVASSDLYPAVFLLDGNQDRVAFGALSTVEQGPAIICSKAGGAALGLCDGARGSKEPDAEPPADSKAAGGNAAGGQASDSGHQSGDGARFLRLDQRLMGNVYMVCLKIMIAGSRPWEVNFDRVHLYSRL